MVPTPNKEQSVASPRRLDCSTHRWCASESASTGLGRGIRREEWRGRVMGGRMMAGRPRSPCVTIASGVHLTSRRLRCRSTSVPFVRGYRSGRTPPPPPMQRDRGRARLSRVGFVPSRQVHASQSTSLHFHAEIKSCATTAVVAVIIVIIIKKTIIAYLIFMFLDFSHHCHLRRYPSLLTFHSLWEAETRVKEEGQHC